MIFSNETAAADDGRLFDCCGNESALLSPIAGALQDDGVRVNDCAAAASNRDESCLARIAIPGHACLVGAHIVRPKKWNLSRPRPSSDPVAVLLAIPYEITRFREVTVVPEGRQSRLKKRLLRFWVR